MQNTIPKVLILDINSSLDIPSSTTVSEQCKICGARNLCSNFGVITCDSCRIFFKRNAKRDQVS
jgi:hypothetical protein